MKKLLMSLLFSRKQREVIWQALLFSEHTYRRRGDVDNAANVQMVINETQDKFGIIKKIYTLSEVNDIIARVIKQTKEEAEEKLAQAFNNGVKSCKKEIENAYIQGGEDAMAKIAAAGIAVINNIEEKTGEVEETKNTEEVENTTTENQQVENENVDSK